MLLMRKWPFKQLVNTSTNINQNEQIHLTSNHWTRKRAPHIQM